MNEPSPAPAYRDCGGELVFTLEYWRARRALWTGTLTVIALGVFREAWFALYQSEPFGGPLLNLDSENSLPEWWSTFQLLLAAGLVLLNGLPKATAAGRPTGSRSP